MFDYIFYADIQASLADTRLQNALRHLKVQSGPMHSALIPLTVQVYAHYIIRDRGLQWDTGTVLSRRLV